MDIPFEAECPNSAPITLLEVGILNRQIGIRDFDPSIRTVPKSATVYRQRARITQNPATRQGALVDVTGGAVTGTAYTLRENGMIMHEVIAVLPDPESGAFYEGWLVSSGPQGGVISTGKMVKQSDGSWMLAFAADDEYEGYDFVVITLEKVEDANPEVHILEGTVQ